MKNSIALLILAASLACVPATRLGAQQGAAENTADRVAAPVEQGPEDALNRGTPRGSIIGFLLACEAFDFTQAAEFLDLRNLPADVQHVGGPELARQLNQVIARTVWLDDYSVSDKPEGAGGDGLPDFRDELLRIKTASGEVPILMQRVPREDGEMIWKVSNRSVALIPGLYEEFSYSPAVETVRSWFPEGASFLGLEAFKWFISFALALASLPLFYLVGVLLARLLSSPERPIYPLLRRVMTGPIVALGVLAIWVMSLKELGMGARAQQVAQARTLSTLVAIWVLWSIIGLIRGHLQQKLEHQGRLGAARLTRPLATFLKLLVLLLALLFWLSNLGINITTLLAGLGVGGLAVALALQKPLEDLMGALTIFSQAPIRVGDFCRYGDITGVVEDIGLRSVRLRTLTNTVVSIPNARIAHTEVENFTMRQKIRYWPTLRLRYDTKDSQIREICSNIMNILDNCPRITDDPVRARFTDFEDDALLIKVNAYVDTTDFAEFLEIAGELNLDLMKIVREAGAHFALPGRTLYMEGAVPGTLT